MEKTPISRLQEICAHNGLSPEYQLLSVEGVVHAPTFIYRVQCGDVSVTATGQSKKKAKHAVAKKAIEYIIKESDYEVENPEVILEILRELDISEANESEMIEEKSGDGDDEEGSDTNPVGKLQEICMKRHWRPPLYETVSEEGLPHERIFKMKCIIENMDFSETGVGKSKRLAKRKAAQLMTKRLKDENLADNEDIADKNNKSLDSSFLENYIESKSSGKVIPAKEKIDNFYTNFTEETKDKIEDLINSCVDVETVTEMGLRYDSDYLTKLSELTKLLDCTFKVLTVPQLSFSSTYQCMIHIIPNEISYSDLPVLTSWGSAEQLEDAKQTAAGNGIKLFSFLAHKQAIDVKQ
ncbi:unnamed protein product [Medioppia subpectinata]|uniref:DRBM domain-containing protein n=1 Tax=Medioppia subpectinata TaxID=1979941 RepID=A0A7R9KNM5_9ACAR|nr:unnamed protein product [Medioppia subpectinata]CAG2105903.1 unnamed protein product [Medioppia subpectinata]